MLSVGARQAVRCRSTDEMRKSRVSPPGRRHFTASGSHRGVEPLKFRRKTRRWMARFRRSLMHNVELTLP